MLHQRLQAKLESGEPKCANCKHWDRFVEVPNLGGCLNIAVGERSKTERGHEYSGQIPLTTDLTVCSKWEMKD